MGDNSALADKVALVKLESAPSGASSLEDAGEVGGEEADSAKVDRLKRRRRQEPKVEDAVKPKCIQEPLLGSLRGVLACAPVLVKDSDVNLEDGEFVIHAVVKRVDAKAVEVKWYGFRDQENSVLDLEDVHGTPKLHFEYKERQMSQIARAVDRRRGVRDIVSQPRPVTMRDFEAMFGFNPERLEHFWRFIHWRHVNHMLRHPDTACVGKRPTELPFVDHVLMCTRTGNAYRHLDSGNKGNGAMMRLRLKDVVLSDPKEALVQSLSMSLIMMSVGRVETFVDWTARVAKKDPKSVPDGVQFILPGTAGEVTDFKAMMHEWQRTKGKAFFTVSYQTQGVRIVSLLNALANPKTRKALGTKMFASTTWHQLARIIQELPCVGSYIGGQALCNMYHGTVLGVGTAAAKWKNLLFPNLDVTSLMHFAPSGPGCHATVEYLFGGVPGSVSDKLKWLAAVMPSEMKRLNIDFPYLRAADFLPGKGQTGPKGELYLTPIDFEHISCYFHRYSIARARLSGGAKELAEVVTAVRQAVGVDILDPASPFIQLTRLECSSNPETGQRKLRAAVAKLNGIVSKPHKISNDPVMADLRQLLHQCQAEKCSLPNLF